MFTEMLMEVLPHDGVGELLGAMDIEGETGDVTT